MNTISVIVPIYNVEKYLQRCIESLIHQTYSALQIILVNDGATDHSLAIAEQYAAQDQRIEVYSQPNQGLSAARNTGIQHAVGKYLSFVDADDYLARDFYDTLISAIGDCDYVQFGYRRVTNLGTILLKKVPHHPYQFHSACMRLYRRDVFTQNQLSFPVGMIYEDILFSMDFWATRPTCKMLNYTGYCYRLNRHSTTAQRNRQAEQRLFAALQTKLRHSNQCAHKWLIIYTIIRLKLYFWKH